MMDHPDTRLLARYALGDVTEEAELIALEDHLLECDECCRRAVAVDLIGTAPADDKVLLHVAAESQQSPTALCGDEASHNIISPTLLSGLDATLVCRKCLAVHRGGGLLLT